MVWSFAFDEESESVIFSDKGNGSGNGGKEGDVVCGGCVFVELSACAFEEFEV